MDIEVAIITGGSAITLFLLRYIVQCVCPGHINCVLRRGCCRSKPHELNPTITLQNLWEERWLRNSEGELKQDADSPRGYKKEHYAKNDRKNNTWVVKIKEEDVKENVGVHIFRTATEKPATENYYLRVKITCLKSDTIDPQVNLFIKRYRGREGHNPNTKMVDHQYTEPVIFNPKCCSNMSIGTGKLFKKSCVGILDNNGDEDVSFEQIGLNFGNSKGEFIVEEAYYSESKTNILSWPNCCYSFYKCYDPKPVKNGEENA